MTIDFHTHIFPDSLAPKAKQALYEGCNHLYSPCTEMTKQSLIERMDEWDIDVSVVQPVITKQSQVVKTNAWARDICDDRIVSFGGIYPHGDDYKRDIDYVVDCGLKGLKFHAEYQDFWVDDIDMLRIYDYAFSKGLIILQHGGFDPAYPAPFKSSPERFANAIKQLGGGTMIVAHLGGHAQWDEVEKYIVGTELLIDTSMGFDYYSEEQFLRIVKNHGANKILFGSDSPWSNAGKEIERMKALPLSENEKNMILGENAKRLLNL